MSDLSASSGSSRSSPSRRSFATPRAAFVRSVLHAPAAVLLSAAFLLALAFSIALPHAVTPYDPLVSDVAHVMQPPDAAHWFGTDRIGRDVFARVIYGARYSLVIGLASMIVSLLIGLAIGMTAGLGRRFVDEGASRVFDVLSAFPPILLSLFVVSFLGQGIVNIAVAVGIAGIPKFGRVLRSQTLVVRRADYVTHAVSYGLSRSQVFVRHVLPNVLAAVPVIATIDVGSAIIAVSGLSFLGLGPQPPTPEWGVMLAEGRDVLRVAWWPSVFPGLAITLTVVAFTVIGKHLSRQYGVRTR
ncbi:ABC transporter permease [Paraburkholderia caballeronis]|uniref:Peptide/nickel transport system permease protein n=1 Tax=Paraburkholderia caballeronis TaxID=416943 RepID=A0A1H7NQ00_9BURK|nr:ABC transporter permease [Paraburkholderia caballeronis]PXW25585.1 peptide/nickel transport system permease protein [Paraburkholderia caballeronis]PXX01192.1 peptide/nickel transport system permease protein [Paraburkholderia caballeronis]RAJ99455.1 peptide/nickel transport system permease protein [Paraburkholderia caballeronis]TDV07167.1 peptide/nickel transport system permease protein [Paraburkholderia caballeronis]TDV11311.1 peptide/nickel transport system permease protein [Paraburkholder